VTVACPHQGCLTPAGPRSVPSPSLSVAGAGPSSGPGPDSHKGVPPPKNHQVHNCCEWKQLAGAAADRAAVGAVSLWSLFCQTEIMLDMQPKTRERSPRSCLLPGTLLRRDSQLSVDIRQQTNDRLFLSLAGDRSRKRKRAYVCLPARVSTPVPRRRGQPGFVPIPVLLLAAGRSAQGSAFWSPDPCGTQPC